MLRACVSSASEPGRPGHVRVGPRRRRRRRAARLARCTKRRGRGLVGLCHARGHGRPDGRALADARALHLEHFGRRGVRPLLPERAAGRRVGHPLAFVVKAAGPLGFAAAARRVQRVDVGLCLFPRLVVAGAFALGCARVLERGKAVGHVRLVVCALGRRPAPLARGVVDEVRLQRRRVPRRAPAGRQRRVKRRHGGARRRRRPSSARRTASAPSGHAPMATAPRPEPRRATATARAAQATAAPAAKAGRRRRCRTDGDSHRRRRLSGRRLWSGLRFMKGWWRTKGRSATNGHRPSTAAARTHWRSRNPSGRSPCRTLFTIRSLRLK
mmetsp:Transcript_24860/g.85191  ORF Transcript_24860/g.85191 Transcript_24860/m.85191 type:complete len:327 (-) Transcript_24860:396-1376(-)